MSILANDNHGPPRIWLYPEAERTFQDRLTQLRDTFLDIRQRETDYLLNSHVKTLAAYYGANTAKA